MANYSGLKNPGLTNKYEKVTMTFYYDSDTNVIISGDVYFNSPSYDLGVKDEGNHIKITALLDKSKNIAYQFGISKDGVNPCSVKVADFNGDEILYEDLDPKFNFAQSVPLTIYLDAGEAVFGPSASTVLSQHIAGKFPADKVWDVDEIMTNGAGGDYYITVSNWQPEAYGVFLLITPRNDFNIIDLCNSYL